ncbi:MAG: hypothetical protein IJ419_00400 [Agathobacter sp.]|nr:hypothetical protein [Agathobacter sp.]
MPDLDAIFQYSEVILTAIGTLVTIFALPQAVKELDESNKQSLFDKRLACYIKLKSLCDTYQAVYGQTMPNDKLLNTLTHNYLFMDIWEQYNSANLNQQIVQLQITKHCDEIGQIADEIDMLWMRKKKRGKRAPDAQPHVESAETFLKAYAKLVLRLQFGDSDDKITAARNQLDEAYKKLEVGPNKYRHMLKDDIRL